MAGANGDTTPVMKIHALRRLGAGPYPTKPPTGMNNAITDRRFWAQRIERPWLYDLFQLLRRVDAQAGQPYALGRAPLPRHEPVRLGQQPSMMFANAAIAAITPLPDIKGHRIDINGFGLFGPNGPLPLHITEYAYQRQQQYQDFSLAAFANIFHHRLILLFYRAWADARHCVSFDRRDNRRFDHYAACLLGLGHLIPQRDAPGSPARYFMAGHLTRQPRNSAGLAAMLRHYFAVPIGIGENRFHWLALPGEQQLRLSRSKPVRLGQTCCLGRAIPDRQYKVQIVIGPLTRREYEQWLPPARQHRLNAASGNKPAQLKSWLSHYLGMEYLWEMQLILAADHYQGCRLGEPQPLGQRCWLGTNPGQRDRADFIYRPDPMAVT